MGKELGWRYQRNGSSGVGCMWFFIPWDDPYWALLESSTISTYRCAIGDHLSSSLLIIDLLFTIRSWILISPMNLLVVVISHLAFKIRQKAPPAAKFQAYMDCTLSRGISRAQGVRVWRGGGGASFWKAKCLSQWRFHFLKNFSCDTRWIPSSIMATHLKINTNFLPVL
jgi:hypothetical protein